MQALDALRDAVKGRWRLIVVIFILTTLATTTAVYMRRPSYESTAALLVNVERFGVSASRSDIRQDVAVLQVVEAGTWQAEVFRSRVLGEGGVNNLAPAIFDRPPSSNPVLRFISGLVNA